MGLDFRTVFDHILNISVIDWVEYLSQWFIAEYSVIAYLWNISISLFSLRSWALLSLMVWLRACSDNRSAYSLWENLAPCSTMDDSVSCWRKKGSTGILFTAKFIRYQASYFFRHKVDILPYFCKRGFLRDFLAAEAGKLTTVVGEYVNPEQNNLE